MWPQVTLGTVTPGNHLHWQQKTIAKNQAQTNTKNLNYNNKDTPAHTNTILTQQKIHTNTNHSNTKLKTSFLSTFYIIQPERRMYRPYSTLNIYFTIQYFVSCM